MRFFKIFITLCIVFLCFGNIFGQANRVGIEWQRVYGMDSMVLITIPSILQSINGEYLVGRNYTFYDDGRAYSLIQKLNQNFESITEIKVDSSQLEKLIFTKDSAIIAGFTFITKEKDVDFCVIKLDLDLNIMWQKKIGGSDADFLSDLIQTSEGGYLIGGSSSSNISGDKNENNLGELDYWILKLDINGNIEWQNTIGGEGNEELYSVCQTSDTSYIIAGNSDSNMSFDKTEASKGYNDYWVIKLDKLGNILWDKSYGGSNSEENVFLYALENDYYFLCGHSKSNISFDKSENSFNGSNDLWLLKIDNSGNIVWDKTIGGNKDDEINYGITQPIIKINNNGYILISSSESDSSYFKSEDARNSSYDYWIIKIDSNGNKVWDKTIGGDDYDESNCIISTYQNGFIICGSSNSSISGDKLVDSTGYSDAWILKLFEDPLTITGNIFYDENNNCNLSTENPAIKNFSLRANSTDGDAFYTTTNAEGKYLLSVDDTGSYAFQLLPNESFNLFQPTACNNYNLHLTDTIDTLNFGMHPTKSCLFNTANISTSSLFRRCVENTFYVQYANNGTISSPNTYIDVRLDDLLAFNSASIPYQDLGNNVYRFELGTVNFLESGNFTFNATPICDLTSNGQTLCVEAHIYPDSVCTLVDYRGANISASGECLGDSVRFILRNRGSNMAEPKIYIVIEGDVVRIREDYQLASEESLDVKIKAINGATYRIIAEQPTDFPSELGDNFTTAVVEGCRPNPDDPFETGFVNQFSNYDGEPYSSVSCNTIIGSYDPNDKSAFPIGVGNQHFIEANTTIDYLIRFQNTGNDTAFKVILIDTISNFLDINSIEFGASSHPYNFERIDSNVVQFVFSPIYLVDSFTNEPASNGFVRFKIRQKKDVPVGSTINNTADIYFDFNAPIRTNTTIHKIGKDFLQIQLTDIKNHTQQSVTIKAFPNPFKDKTYIYITSGNIEDAVLVLTNVQGQVIKTIPVNNGNQFEIHRNDLPIGVYFFSILSQNKLLISGKVMAE